MAATYSTLVPKCPKCDYARVSYDAAKHHCKCLSTLCGHKWMYTPTPMPTIEELNETLVHHEERKRYYTELMDDKHYEALRAERLRDIEESQRYLRELDERKATCPQTLEAIEQEILSTNQRIFDLKYKYVRSKLQEIAYDPRTTRLDGQPKARATSGKRTTKVKAPRRMIEVARGASMTDTAICEMFQVKTLDDLEIVETQA